MTNNKTTALAVIIRGIIAKHGGFEPHKHEQHVMNYVAQIREAIAAFEQPAVRDGGKYEKA